MDDTPSSPSPHDAPRPIPGLAPHPATLFVPPRGTTFQFSWRSPLDRGNAMPLLASLLLAREKDGWIPTSAIFPPSPSVQPPAGVPLDHGQAGPMLAALVAHQARNAVPNSAGKHTPTALSWGPISFLLPWQGLRSVSPMGAMVWSGFPTVFSPDRARMRVLPWEVSWSGTKPIALVLGAFVAPGKTLAHLLADAVLAYPTVARDAAERAAGMPALPWSLFEGMDGAHKDWPEGDRWPLAAARAIARFLGLPADSAYKITISGARWKTWDAGPDRWLEDGGILPPEAALHVSVPPGMPSATLQALLHTLFQQAVAERARRDPLAWMRRDGRHAVDTILSCRPAHGAMTSHLRLLEERMLVDMRAARTG